MIDIPGILLLLLLLPPFLLRILSLPLQPLSLYPLSFFTSLSRGKKIYQNQINTAASLSSPAIQQPEHFILSETQKGVKNGILLKHH